MIKIHFPSQHFDFGKFLTEIFFLLHPRQCSHWVAYKFAILNRLFDECCCLVVFLLNQLLCNFSFWRYIALLYISWVVKQGRHFLFQKSCQIIWGLLYCWVLITYIFFLLVCIFSLIFLFLSEILLIQIFLKSEQEPAAISFV